MRSTDKDYGSLAYDGAQLLRVPLWVSRALLVDKLTNRQAAMHYSRHCLTASVSTWLRSRTHQPMTCSPIDQFVKN